MAKKKKSTEISTQPEVVETQPEVVETQPEVVETQPETIIEAVVETPPEFKTFDGIRVKTAKPYLMEGKRILHVGSDPLFYKDYKNVRNSANYFGGSIHKIGEYWTVKY